MKLYRFDFIFSYWIFIWYLLYKAKWFPWSPKLALIIGLLTNIYDLVFFLIQNVKAELVVVYVGLMFILKIIPLITIRNIPMVFGTELKRFCGVFLIYLVWMLANGHTMDEASRQLKTLYMQGKSSATWTPATELFLDIKKAFVQGRIG